MKLTIHELLGVRDAEINLEPGAVVEVVGPNESGKTSTALCAQAVLARAVNPLGLPVADARKAYLRDGDLAGFALLEGEGGMEVAWRPGTNEIQSPASGEFAAALSRPEAAGLVDFTARIGAKERAGLLHSVLLPPPDAVIGKLKEHLAPMLPAEDLDGVIELVRQRGWKVAESTYVERMRVAKRGWEQVAGRKYGVKIATDWRPEGWRGEWDRLTVAEAEASVVTAREALSGLHRVDAVSEAEQQAAEDAEAVLPEVKARLETAEEAVRAAEGFVGEHDADLMAMRRQKEKIMKGVPSRMSSKPEAVKCPHCQQALLVKGCGVVSFDVDAWNAENERIEGLRAEAEKSVKKVDERIGKLQAFRGKAYQDLQDAQHHHVTVRAELADLQRKASRKGTVETEQMKRAIAAAEDEVEAKKLTVETVKAARLAESYYQTAEHYSAIASALGVGGVRAKMLESGLQTLNAGLAALSKVSGWPKTEVAPNGSITYRGRPAPLCSESSQWRIQAMMQLTIAAMTGSRAVVLDRADLLDAPNRIGLVKAVKLVTSKKPVAVLLCSTGKKMGESSKWWPQVEIFEGVVR